MKKFTIALAVAAAVAVPSAAQFSVVMGTGTTVNTTTTYPAPYGNWYWGSHHQMVFLASELAGAGILPGPINSMALDVAAVNGPALSGFTISGALTTATTAGAWITGLSTLYTSAAYTPVLGWNTHVFASPIMWDGTSNVVIDTCFNNASYTTNCIVNQSATSFVSTREFHQDAAGTCASASLSSTYSQRPNVMFDVGLISSPMFQTNSARLALKINNTAGTAYVPTTVTQLIYNCSPPQPATGAVKLDTVLLGQLWDIGFSTTALVPNGLTLPDGQIVNLNLAAPLAFLNGGFATAFPSFPGSTSLSLSFNYAFAAQTDFAIQAVAFDPTAGSGLRVSQATQYHGNFLPAQTSVAGPNADTIGTQVTFTTAPTCWVPSVSFYGVNYTTFWVQSNGQVTFTGSNTSGTPTTATALSSVPHVGFWTDLNPALAGPGGLGSVTITNPGPGLVSVNYNAIPYAAEAGTANSYQIVFDATLGTVSLTGLTGIVANPQTALGTGDAQWLGICRGSLGSTDPGNTTFTAGGFGTASTATSCWRDFYLQVAGGAGKVGSLVPNTLSSIIFVPSSTAAGNYDWLGF